LRLLLPIAWLLPLRKGPSLPALAHDDDMQ